MIKIHPLKFSFVIHENSIHRVSVSPGTENEVTDHNPQPYRISTGHTDDMYLDHSLVDELLRLIFESGAVRSEGMRFINCNISNFPSLKYSFYDHVINHSPDRFNRIVDIIIPPEDFVSVGGNDECIVHVAAAHDGAHSGIIGMNLLRNINAHFDRIEGKVGFCDPLSDSDFIVLTSAAVFNDLSVLI